ncbi:glycosyltransferase involved in cell wall biosynthesis [Variovorax boronicumulans]|uniref:glycosyltransferase family 2 protein n=1 Tax=Variovorax boronicumulans TaxID=436515 RepID=UPI0027887796|nr:glycosyltransferase family 2 protein [Variovorax boronicumulans]MDQ0013660.1 glycosyltransferase involved in cell wall biosynthesis [Variovorax boronicumulans]
MEKAVPKVSVCIVTYNQEKYIRQCLQSILDQEISFDLEIIVADDCSSDGTRDILMEYLLRYPEIIKLHLHTANIGPYKNFVFVHRQAIGEYIAHIDGDDYCLPGKLQMQSDLLDREHECNIVWHKMTIESPSGARRESPRTFAGEMKFYRGDILQYISIGANSSKMYRKSIREFEDPDFDVVDYFVNVEQVGEGYARLIDDRSYGVYRAGIGISSSGNKTRLILRDCFYFFARKYPQYSSRVNSAALIYFLADLKNGRKTWRIFLVVWLKTFSLFSVLRLASHLRFARQISEE